MHAHPQAATHAQDRHSCKGCRANDEVLHTTGYNLINKDMLHQLLEWSGGAARQCIILACSCKRTVTLSSLYWKLNASCSGCPKNPI